MPALRLGVMVVLAAVYSMDAVAQEVITYATSGNANIVLSCHILQGCTADVNLQNAQEGNYFDLQEFIEASGYKQGVLRDPSGLYEGAGCSNGDCSVKVAGYRGRWGGAFSRGFCPAGTLAVLRFSANTPVEISWLVGKYNITNPDPACQNVEGRYRCESGTMDVTIAPRTPSLKCSGTLPETLHCPSAYASRGYGSCSGRCVNGAAVRDVLPVSPPPTDPSDPTAQPSMAPPKMAFSTSPTHSQNEGEESEDTTNNENNNNEEPRSSAYEWMGKMAVVSAALPPLILWLLQ